MRPPHGIIDPVVAGLVGVPVILWTVDTQDWRTSDTERVVSAVRELPSCRAWGAGSGGRPGGAGAA